MGRFKNLTIQDCHFTNIMIGNGPLIKIFGDQGI